MSTGTDMESAVITNKRGTETFFRICRCGSNWEVRVSVNGDYLPNVTSQHSSREQAVIALWEVVAREVRGKYDHSPAK